MMHILHISSATTWRGGERQIAYLMTGFQNKNVRQILLCPSNSALENFCIEENLPYTSIEKKGGISYSWAKKISEISKKHQITHIHTHDSKSHSHAIFAAFIDKNIPNILVSRRVIFPIKNSFFTKYKYNHPKVKGIICISDAVKKVVQTAIPNAHTFLVSSAISFGKGNHLVQENVYVLEHKFPLSKNKKKIGYIAALSGEKDHLTFIKTAERILQSRKDVVFFIIGEGNERAKIEAEINQRNLTKNIILTGFIKQINQIIPQIDVLLFTSISEGLGSTVLDFFKEKIPVVVTECGGIQELVISEKTGLSSPIGDYKDLSRNVLRLLEDEDLQKKLTNHAFQLLTEKHSISQLIESTLNVYDTFNIKDNLSKNLKITTIIPTLNEAENIEYALQSVLFTDEIILIDSYSKDQTLALAAKYPVKIIQRKFDNFSNQKNYALGFARNNWILFLDADESISESLQQEIIENLKNNQQTSAFKFKLNYYFLHRLMRYGEFQSKYVHRLFHKNYCKYDGKLVHEQLKIIGQDKILRHPIKHLNRQSLTEFIDTQKHYASLKAKSLFEQNESYSIVLQYFKTIFRFLKHYILRLGFLDGYPGFKFAIIQAQGVFMRYDFLKEYHQIYPDVLKLHEHLMEGKTILYPTDTVWGLGCDATNIDAVSKIYKIKKRDETKSLVILVDSIEMLEKYVINISSKALEIIYKAEKPTTIIYPTVQNLASNVIAQDGSVAIRIVEDFFCRELIKKFDKPIVSTSANRSGEPTPSFFDEISDEIKTQVSAISVWRQNDHTKTAASTILKIEKDESISILRK